MIELKKEFEYKKYRISYHQLFKDKQLVIYQINQPFAEGDGASTWYEVFRYKTMPPDKFHDDEYELYPKSDEYFGIWAWSCANEKSVNKVLRREFPNHPMAKDGLKC